MGLCIATAVLSTQILVPASMAGASATARTKHLSLAQQVGRVPFSIRLEDQFLAGLHYLPLELKQPSAAVTTTTSTTTTTVPTSTTTTTTVTTTTSTTTTTVPTSTTTTTIPQSTTVAPALSTTLVRGNFVWRFPTLPGVLKSQWSVGTNNVVLEGALMRFQSDHNLPTTGANSPASWHAIVAAVIQKRYDPTNYSYVYVNQRVPQELKLYINGKVVFTTAVNTGITASPTQNGTYPVYLRYTSQTMSGINPNGTPYHDAGLPWVSYFHGGDALHGFIRATYGWPQSLGCVEMPFAHAGIVWPHTPIGTLVSVQ